MNLCESCKTAECIFRKEGRIVHVCHLHDPITIADLAAKDAEIAKLKQAPAVVVPELTMFDVNREYFENFANVFTSAKEREAHKTGFLAGVDWFRARAIPAHRELGEGMVQVEPGLLMLLDKAIESCKYAPQHVLREAIRDALRANQGGAAM